MYDKVKSENVVVSVVLPPNDQFSSINETLEVHEDCKTVAVRREGAGQDSDECQWHVFDRVFKATASLRDIYDGSGASRIADSFLSRYGKITNGNIITFGAAESDFLFGCDGADEGIAQMIICTLLDLTSETKLKHLFSSRLKLTMSFVEFRGQGEMFDLLAPVNGSNDISRAPSLELEECKDGSGRGGKVFVLGAHWEPCRILQDAKNAIRNGIERRANGGSVLLSIKMERLSWENGDLEDVGHINLFSVAETKIGSLQSGSDANEGSSLLDLIVSDAQLLVSSGINDTLIGLVRVALRGSRSTSVLLSVAPHPSEEKATPSSDSVFLRMMKSFPVRSKKPTITEQKEDLAGVTMEQEGDMVLLTSSVADNEGLGETTPVFPSGQMKEADSSQSNDKSCIFRPTSGLDSATHESEHSIGSSGQKREGISDSCTEEKVSPGKSESSNEDKASLYEGKSNGGDTILASVPSSSAGERDLQDFPSDSASRLSLQGSLGMSLELHSDSDLDNSSKTEIADELVAPDGVLKSHTASQITDTGLSSAYGDEPRLPDCIDHSDHADKVYDDVSVEGADASVHTETTSDSKAEDADEILAPRIRRECGPAEKEEHSVEEDKLDSPSPTYHDLKVFSVAPSNNLESCGRERSNLYREFSDKKDIQYGAMNCGDGKLEVSSPPGISIGKGVGKYEKSSKAHTPSAVASGPNGGVKKSASLPNLQQWVRQSIDHHNAAMVMIPTPQQLFATDLPESRASDNGMVSATQHFVAEEELEDGTSKKESESAIQVGDEVSVRRHSATVEETDTLMLLDTSENHGSPVPEHGKHDEEAFASIGKQLFLSSRAEMEASVGPGDVGRAMVSIVRRRKFQVMSVFLLLSVIARVLLSDQVTYSFSIKEKILSQVPDLNENNKECDAIGISTMESAVQVGRSGKGDASEDLLTQPPNLKEYESIGVTTSESAPKAKLDDQSNAAEDSVPITLNSTTAPSERNGGNSSLLSSANSSVDERTRIVEAMTPASHDESTTHFEAKSEELFFPNSETEGRPGSSRVQRVDQNTLNYESTLPCSSSYSEDSFIDNQMDTGTPFEGTAAPSTFITELETSTMRFLEELALLLWVVAHAVVVIMAVIVWHLGVAKKRQGGEMRTGSRTNGKKINQSDSPRMTHPQTYKEVDCSNIIESRGTVEVVDRNGNILERRMSPRLLKKRRPRNTSIEVDPANIIESRGTVMTTDKRGNILEKRRSPRLKKRRVKNEK